MDKLTAVLYLHNLVHKWKKRRGRFHEQQEVFGSRFGLALLESGGSVYAEIEPETISDQVVCWLWSIISKLWCQNRMKWLDGRL